VKFTIENKKMVTREDPARKTWKTKMFVKGKIEKVDMENDDV
jgi:hypothetical protein